jgi:hypothetical protein
LKVIVYGHTGARKSSFAKTFPKPMLVWQFDAHGKDFPYWRDSEHNILPPEAIGELNSYQIEGTSIFIPYRDIQHPDGPVRIEYYHDEDPEKPHAYNDWKIRKKNFALEAEQWATLVDDSLTSHELTTRMYYKYVLNPQTDKEFKSRNPLQWFGNSTDALEEALKGSYMSYQCNVVIVAHVDTERDESAMVGQSARNPMAPGRLRGGLAQQYMELYYAYVYTDPQTKQTMGLLQTQPNGQFHASTQIGAPNPCYGHYESLWELFDREQAGRSQG